MSSRFALRKSQIITVKDVLDMGCRRRELWSVVAALELAAAHADGGERRALRWRSATVKKALAVLDHAPLPG